jgi:hypothetical protein
MLAASVSIAEAETINPTIYGSVRNTPQGQTTHVGVIPDAIRILNWGAGLPQDRGIIEFEIIALSQPLASATLNLFDTGSFLTSSHSFDVFGYAGDGLLTDADYSAGTLIGSFNYFDKGSVAFDVTSFLNSQLGGSYAAFRIVWGDAPVNYQEVNFGRTYLPELNPTLEVTPVPLPAGAWLLLSALGGLGFFGWRRKRTLVAQLEP